MEDLTTQKSLTAEQCLSLEEAAINAGAERTAADCLEAIEWLQSDRSKRSLATERVVYAIQTKERESEMAARNRIESARYAALTPRQQRAEEIADLDREPTGAFVGGRAGKLAAIAKIENK
jgi:precorrin-6B methylase 2